MSCDLTFLFHRLEQERPGYPARLLQRLGDQAPPVLVALGNMDLLALPRTALFCSAKEPGSAILAVHDEATRLRDEGHCVISGFHSPIEKQCLQILLRGKQPFIICPGRAIEPIKLYIGQGLRQDLAKLDSVPTISRSQDKAKWD